MKVRSLLVAFVFVGIAPAAVLANTWCSTHYPDKVFCDDFDRYCKDAPSYPQECPVGSDPSIGSLRTVWDQGLCGTEFSIDATYITSLPFAGRYPCQGDAQLGNNMVMMTSYIQARFGTGYQYVAATDLTPLVLEFVMDGQTFGKIDHANAAVQLALSYDFGPTNYILAENCSLACTPPGPDIAYPMICQQNAPPADCPPIEEARKYYAIAAGALAYLDTNPCHCENPSDPAPITEHLAIFDGHKWWTLRQGLFPGGGTGGVTPGDFRLRNRQNNVRLTVKSTSVKVELTCTEPEPDEYSWCEVPRQYTGPYDTLSVGFPMACELKGPTSWGCADQYRCIRGAPGAGAPCFDNLALYGGQGYVLPSACCLPDGSCQKLSPQDCQTLGGVFHGPNTRCDEISCVPLGACCLPDFSCDEGSEQECTARSGTYRGDETSCATTACCPALPADSDRDGDVDQEDYGWFQACLSGVEVSPADNCRCADLDGDWDVDVSDRSLFVDCMTGADIFSLP
jgi:hypothetical protein